ncbi:hypothetical protein DSCO28_38790 [Desulfosarcina ovata subsp. sediminis]|uniref:Uncharacterized protein n=1 Tax=Desulfosarcina ovata subsp. sediminis TaxID=885957 RepID=A0A5K7ZSX3_9BACT|nr:hypothetical protein [Desulfosarcina ovata]BBO83313.1 hypothetical protein DSCO28_38790 [Desulfosarcina ovata subsp. sediminis]
MVSLSCWDSNVIPAANLTQKKGEMIWVDIAKSERKKDRETEDEFTFGKDSQLISQE